MVKDGHEMYIVYVEFESGRMDDLAVFENKETAWKYAVKFETEYNKESGSNISCYVKTLTLFKEVRE